MPPREPSNGEVNDVIDPDVSASDPDLGAEDTGEGLEDDLLEGEGNDDGADGDEAGPGEVGDEPPRGPRENETVRALRERAQRAEAERERIAAERDEALRRVPAATAPTAAELAQQKRERDEYLATLTPERRVEFLLNEQSQAFSRQLNQVQLNTAQQADRQAFNILCTNDPVARKNRDAVERLVQEKAGQGVFLEREVALNFIAGKQMRERVSKAAPKQQASAAQRVERERGRAVDTRSSRAPERNRAPQDDRAARRERLKGVQI